MQVRHHLRNFSNIISHIPAILLSADSIVKITTNVKYFLPVEQYSEVSANNGLMTISSSILKQLLSNRDIDTETIKNQYEVFLFKANVKDDDKKRTYNTIDSLSVLIKPTIRLQALDKARRDSLTELTLSLDSVKNFSSLSKYIEDTVQQLDATQQNILAKIVAIGIGKPMIENWNYMSKWIQPTSEEAGMTPWIRALIMFVICLFVGFFIWYILVFFAFKFRREKPNAESVEEVNEIIKQNENILNQAEKEFDDSSLKDLPSVVELFQKLKEIIVTQRAVIAAYSTKDPNGTQNYIDEIKALREEVKRLKQVIIEKTEEIRRMRESS